MYYMHDTLYWRIFVYFSTLLFANHAESYSWYSNIGELRNLTKADKLMLHDLKDMLFLGNATINLLEMQIDTIMELSTDYVETLNDNTSRYEHSNQYSQWLDRQLSLLPQDISPFNSNRTKAICDEIRTFPSTADLTVSRNVLLDLQKLNNLAAKDVATGYPMDTFSGRPLSAKSCYELAAIACRKSEHYDYEFCLDWCDEAYLKVNDTDADYNEEAIFTLIDAREEMLRYSELCSASLNETYIEHPSNPKLTCFLWDNNHHPRLVLQPVRAELLSDDPTIVMFYNIISDRDIEYIINMASSRLGKAVTTGTVHDRPQFDGYRVAHNCWIYEQRLPIMKKLNRVENAVTRLPVNKYLEPLQVANYGVGGQYKPHYDSEISLQDPTKSILRRATLMYYLSDVEYGGATVFVRPGIAVRPVKGAAIYWHNMLWDMDSIDERTSHGSCPVLLGNKWVANKWILDTGRSKCQEHLYHL